MLRHAGRWGRKIKGTLRTSMKNEVCPNCFREIRLGQAPFRCISPPQACRPEPDPVLSEHWSVGVPVGRVIPPTGQFELTAECLECHTASGQRICPVCHADLPRTIGEYDNFVIAIVGLKEVGKSNFITVLIETLRQDGRRQFGLLVSAENEYTQNRFENEFRKPLYDQMQSLDVTQTAFINKDIKRPLVFNIRNVDSNSGIALRKNRFSTLSFFDSAGEDLESEATMSAVNRYIFKADGIVLLIDPLQFPLMRRELEDKIRLPEPSAPVDKLVNSIARLVRQGQELSEKTRIETPIAATLSKTDVLEGLHRIIDPGTPMLQASDHSKGFDRQDFENVSADVEELIGRLGGHPLVNELHANFRHVGFFASSSFGAPPDENMNIQRLSPRRVVDPFIWLMTQKGILSNKGP